MSMNHHLCTLSVYTRIDIHDTYSCTSPAQTAPEESNGAKGIYRWCAKKKKTCYVIHASFCLR